MSRKQGLTAEEKIRIVREIKSGEVGLREAERNTGISNTTIRGWLRWYETEGASGFLPGTPNRVYSQVQKEEAVRAYLAGKGSLSEICREYKIRDTHTLREWIKVYNAQGNLNSIKFSGGGSYMKQGRSTTQEERVQIAKDCIASGRNYGEMALKYQVSYQQVRTWTLRFEKMGETGLQDRRGRRKKDQVPRTELERAQIEIE